MYKLSREEGIYDVEVDADGMYYVSEDGNEVDITLTEEEHAELMECVEDNKRWSIYG